MQDNNIISFADLDTTKRREAVEVFVDGFGHLLSFAKTNAEKVTLFAESFDETLVHVYIINNHVVGVLGLSTNLKRTITIDKQLCKELFGKGKGQIIYWLLRISEETPRVKNDTDLYIDFLATSSQMRGQGIATKLLNFACALPGYHDCYLDVLSKNIPAITLYQKLNFVVHKKVFNIFACIQGIGQPIIMKKCQHGGDSNK